MEFMTKLREARIAAGLTQKQVAEAMGITSSTYCGYETGKRTPDVTKIKQLSKVLGIAADDLLDTGVTPRSAVNYGGLTYEEMCQLHEYNTRGRFEAAYSKLDIIGRQKVADFAEKLLRDPKYQRDLEFPYAPRPISERNKPIQNQDDHTPDATAATDAPKSTPNDK